MKIKVVVLVLFAAFMVNGYTTGLSGKVNLNQINIRCFLDNGISDYMQWAFDNKDIVDDAKQNLARLIGIMKSVSLLIRPHVSVSPIEIATRVCDEIVSGTEWVYPVHIEVYQNADNWYTNPIANRNYLEQLVDAFASLKQCFNSVRFVSDAISWDHILGSTYRKYSNRYLVWNQLYKDACNRLGWVDFGGWSQPGGLRYMPSNICAIPTHHTCYWEVKSRDDSVNNTSSPSHI